MPIYEVNGRKANVKDESIDKFLKQYPSAKLVDSTPYYLSRTNSTPRESNIQNDTGNQTDIFQGNKTLDKNIPQNRIDLTVGTPGIDLKIKGSDIPAQGELNVVPGIDPLKRGKPLSETVRSAVQNMPASPEAQFDMSVDKYRIDKENIDRIKNDNTLSEDVKQTLINDYQNNIRTSDLTVDNEDLSPSAKDWLKRNELTKKVAAGYDRAKNEVVYQDIKYNSPEQIAFIKDYEANSVEGKAQAKAHKEFIDGLEGEADTLLDQIEGIRDASARSKKEYAERHNISISSLKGTNYRNDALLDKASNLLKNTKL